MEGVGRLSEGCGEAVRRVWGGCMEGVRRQSGGCGEVILGVWGGYL